MSMSDFIGQTLGQYRIETLIDAGGMGQVFRGVHTYLKRPAAIKVMRPHLASSASFRERFLQEAQSAAALKHPNIVDVHVLQPDEPIFAQPTTAANLSDGGAVINNHLTDGNPNANIIVTRLGSHGVYNPHQVGVEYRGGKWMIVNEDGTPIPIGASFNVDIVLSST